jgi:hypothetical protein
MQKNSDNCLSINIPRIFKVYRDWAEVGKMKIVCLLHLSLPSTRHRFATYIGPKTDLLYTVKPVWQKCYLS